MAEPKPPIIFFHKAGKSAGQVGKRKRKKKKGGGKKKKETATAMDLKSCGKCRHYRFHPQ